MAVVAHSILELQKAVDGLKRKPVGLVPTMGAPPRRARPADRIVLARTWRASLSASSSTRCSSISERSQQLSTDLHADVALCDAHGVDVVFAPGVQEIPVPRCARGKSRNGRALVWKIPS
jgi:pantothenate synthetase